jgi:hypothetical protein
LFRLGDTFSYYNARVRGHCIAAAAKGKKIIITTIIIIPLMMIIIIITTTKVKLFLSLINHYVIKTYGEWRCSSTLLGATWR